MRLLWNVLRWPKAHLSNEPLLNNIRLRASILIGALRPGNSSYQDATGGALQLEHSLATVQEAHCTCINKLFETENSLLDGLVLWAVPKKRTSHSKKRMRMAHKYLQPVHHYTVCPVCRNLKLMHVLCAYCLKKTLAETAAMRREEIEHKLLNGKSQK